MAIFGRGKGGGMMNVIRCDEPEYLVWKWRPLDQEVNSTTRENSIRYGSSLRVKDGETAVFVYKQKDGTMQDFIEGPYDDTIKTANFPILSSIVGLAFGGESPFQAEIYYINTSGVVKIDFAIPYFDVFDPRFLDYAVPMAVGGSMTFCVDDVKAFIKCHRLINFSLDDLKNQIRDAVVRRVKGVVTNAPQDHQIPVLQIERRIDDINDIVKNRFATDIEDFGVRLKRMDISRIDVDKDSDGYRELRHVTADQQTATIEATNAVNIKNMYDTQTINAENMAESLRIQREESQRAQRLQTESTYLGAHSINRQADVLQTAASQMGSAGSFGGGAGSSGINPAQFMTGMAVGGALGGQMAGMVNQMGQTINQSMAGAGAPPMPGAGPNTPPAMPSAPCWMVGIGGQQYGPYSVDQLQQMVSSGQMNQQTLVWKQGMPQWTAASSVTELAQLFAPAAPPMPGTMPPPMPGSMPPPMP
ncbi:MAG: SPFH domain-containing protein [Bacteroides sp.]|nr:SPFH domain-containing protein [Bacteroides sp.]